MASDYYIQLPATKSEAPFTLLRKERFTPDPRVPHEHDVRVMFGDGLYTQYYREVSLIGKY